MYIQTYIHTGCLDIYGTNVPANNSSNNDVVFFLVSDLKIEYYNNYYSLIMILGQERKKYFQSLLMIWRQNYSKLSQNRCNPLI